MMDSSGKFDLNLPYEGSFNLNEFPEEDNLNEGSFGMDLEEGEKGEIFFEPFIGQCFLSEEEAYIFYVKYAKKHGFSIRKARFDRRKTGEIKRRDFLCHRAGETPLKFFDPSKNQRNRGSTRCECKAHMRITLKKTFDIFPEEWHVTEYIREHNHGLLAYEEVRFLPAYRTITTEDEKQILLLRERGLNVKQIMRVMELQKNVKYGHLPFLAKDVHNFFTRIQNKQVNSDVIELLEHCKLAKLENHNFQYSFTFDDERKLEHIFWSPAHCFDWYQKFGDVVVLDTTYKINAYDMLFGVFVGIDNHGRTILFGCALLRNETTNAFSWLMKTFVNLMKRPPKSILTDQDPWMTRAISQEMPSTKHAFCIWHITSKFSSWFTGILRNKYFKWCSDFYDLYRLDNFEEFEVRWPRVIRKYNMQTNKHVLGLYEIREFWVPAYLRGYFFAGMSTTGRSESINAFVKRFTSPNLRLSQFINQVELAIEDVKQKQLHVKMLETYRGSSLRTLSTIEKEAHDIFTPYAFRKFQEEFERATNYLVQKQTHGEYIVQYHKEGDTQKHKVNWNGQLARCSCQHFEFWGILCRHILTIFLHEDVFSIPPIYFPPRWCRTVTKNGDLFLLGDGHNGSSSINDNIDTTDIQGPPKSKTKGRPKAKRQKGGKELNTKQVKTCRFCKHPGHNYTTCPQKNDGDTTTQSQSRKRKKSLSKDDNLNPIFHVKF